MDGERRGCDSGVELIKNLVWEDSIRCIGGVTVFGFLELRSPAMIVSVLDFNKGGVWAFVDRA